MATARDKRTPERLYKAELEKEARAERNRLAEEARKLDKNATGTNVAPGVELTPIKP